MKGNRQEEFVAFYEAFFWLRGRVPAGVAELNREYNINFKEEEWNKVLTNPKLAEFLEERAVPNPFVEKPALTPKQLDFVRTILDPTDLRPLAVKMKACRVVPAEHSAWMRDPVFARLVRDETTKVLQEGRHTVLRALVREAGSGNVPAIKFYMELTGEYIPKGNAVSVTVGQDVREITQGIIEILQRHVNPAILMLVADELEALLFPATKKQPEPVPIRKPMPVLDVVSVETDDDEEIAL